MKNTILWRVCMNKLGYDSNYYINLLKMWSELFFANLKDAFRQFLPSYSDKDMEYLIYQELKSD